ncbi:ImmA/IrrE family metallo-endopeptidase [Rhodonellum sp.]|uniref:ImmA/IrrE family metallo-endopeptidase n=1 Tax=Rhodonellum sp. TaxID=2231180 RepID=UPI002726E143|nr:ImmA/IrrE family metallo-endopeptidase [Rhodonellum sp.]MDO9553471.1 ImmA/IrrE family metallo-endopeptidase [Rhodonellum sp.]
MKKDDLLRLELKEKASGFRQKFGYAETDPIYLKSFLLKNNVITVFSDLGEGLSGMALKVQEDRFMLVNHGQSLGRQHFTIAHELYHLFVQENFVSRKCVTGLFSNQKDLEEKKADLFAANLLLPETGMLNLIPIAERSGKISEQTIFKIQQYYSVSVKAVIFRLFAMGLVDKSYFDAFSGGLSSRANRLGYDGRLFFKGNENLVVGDYAVLANQLYGERKMSESLYFEFLNSVNIDPLQTADNGEE